MKYYLMIGLTFASLNGWTQSSKKVPYDSTLSKSEIRIGLWYSSDYYFMGRNDSTPAPYLSPSITYSHKSGMFIRSNISILTSKEQMRVDMFGLTGGYDYYGERLAWGISLSEYFFSESSYVVQAEMSTYINSFVGYDFSAFTLFADASLGISEGTDLFLGTEVSRIFYILNNRLSIRPSLTLNAGTQKYYDQYYQYRSTESGFGKGKDGKGKGNQSTTTNVYLTSAEKFQMLDYEASLQLAYRLQKIRLFTIATWTFPVNPSTIVADNTTQEEILKNGFFWSAGVRLSLSGK